MARDFKTIQLQFYYQKFVNLVSEHKNFAVLVHYMLAKVGHCARWSDERYWSSIYRHRSKPMKISIGFISILCRFIRLDVIHGSIELCIGILSLGASNFIITSHGPRKIQSRLVSKPMERRVGGVEIE